MVNDEKQAFLKSLDSGKHQFADTIAFVERWYDFTPSAFLNGELKNGVNENQGSCKVFALSRLLDLTKQQTLCCFGEYFEDVIATPENTDHQNIRQFMLHGSSGVSFDSFPLTERTS